MISAVLEGRLRDAEWDAEIARQCGNTAGLLDAVSEIELINEQRARLSDVGRLDALETEM